MNELHHASLVFSELHHSCFCDWAVETELFLWLRFSIYVIYEIELPLCWWGKCIFRDDNCILTCMPIIYGYGLQIQNCSLSSNKTFIFKELEYDEESFPSESEDGCSTTKRSRRNDRRKHQKMWTLPEVMKLVEGISEYGVGRWTDIKRFLFSSSSYRTPIDLRDKWRNLLRASSAQKNKREAEQNDELALRPLPFNVVHRVRELAKIHPYPRQRGSKKSRVSQAGSFVIAKDSPSKRSVRRKKCT